MKRMVKTCFFASLLVLAILCLNFGCNSRVAQDPETLTVQISNEPVTLDPSLAEDGMSLRILANTHEGLVSSDSEGHFKYRLAESVQISKDRKTYRFHLKPGAKWSDGVPVTVADFILGIHRGLDKKNGAKLAPLFSAIDSVSNLDGDLVIQLKHPVGYFLDALSLGVVSPLRADVLEKNSGKWPVIAPATGPYFIRKHITDQVYELERNPYYSPSPSVKNVILRIVADESTALELFNQKRFDILTRVPSYETSALEKKGLIRRDTFYATYFLAFNTRKEPFQSAEMRRAVSASIDPFQIAQALATGDRPARSWIPFDLEGYLPFEMKAPKSDLKVVPVKTAKIKTSFDSSSRNSMILEKVQNDLKTKLGLELDLQPMDWKSYVKTIQTDAPPLYRFGWMAPFRDPITHLKAFVSNDPNNYTGWKNAEYDRLISEIEMLDSGTERLAKILKAQMILVDQEAVVIPIYHYTQIHAAQPRVKGFKANPFAIIRFDEIKLEKP